MSHPIDKLALDDPYDEAFFMEKYQPLLHGDPIDLFAEGGCHVFAIALQERFGYPLRLLRKDEDGSVSHVYCYCGVEPCYAVDVLGHTEERARLWDFGLQRPVHELANAGLGYPAPSSWDPVIDITVNELRQHFTVKPGKGLFAHRNFMVAARISAEERISKYLEFYDGSSKCRTPDARV